MQEENQTMKDANHVELQVTEWIQQGAFVILGRVKGYLKKGLSMYVVRLTNSIEPPISQVMSEMPTRGLPFSISS